MAVLRWRYGCPAEEFRRRGTAAERGRAPVDVLSALCHTLHEAVFLEIG